jgi:N-formylglutamate amidohydrolase
MLWLRRPWRAYLRSVKPSPFHIVGPNNPAHPVIVSVPHAGRVYPDGLIAHARVDPAVLQRLEDRHADALAVGLVEAGYTVLIADIARAWIDLNRGEEEWDRQIVGDAPPPPHPNRRVRAGLGLVPASLHPHGPLWRSSLSVAELNRRIETVHRPWHQAVARHLSAAQDRFGAALLFDLHSMPRQSRGTPQLVIGDRHGATASGELVDLLLGIAEGAGLSVARNSPYAGAYGIERHGRRGSAIEAVQVEIDRSLYLDDVGHPRAADVRRIGAMLRRMADAAGSWLTSGMEFPLAAE